MDFQQANVVGDFSLLIVTHHSSAHAVMFLTACYIIYVVVVAYTLLHNIVPSRDVESSTYTLWSEHINEKQEEYRGKNFTLRDTMA